MLGIFLIIVLIVSSLYILLKGANYLIDGAVDVSRWFRISPIFVGLTVVAFGTSLPEFMISLFSVLNGDADLSIGNIIGSNIFNIAFIIGLSAIIRPLTVRSSTLINEFPFMTSSAFLLLILASDHFLFGENVFILGRIDGIIFLLLFSCFIAYILANMNKEKKIVTTEFLAFKRDHSLFKSIFIIISGLAGLIAGGKIFTFGATELAIRAGISEAFIGLTIAAVGTSLPELATSTVAAWKKQMDIAVGNMVGSNIFNILFVLGIVSIIKPISVNPLFLQIDAMVMILVTMLFVLFATRKKIVSRGQGIFFVALYVLYTAFLIWQL
ncbi:calcium/sodium antiporter [Candidatus Woesearchaeota archaeon]|nr:calcium/sodium antiporter [Candidatus Woesearchaeota archaeon]